MEAAKLNAASRHKDSLFLGSGTKEGIEVWRIENFQAVPFKEGKFLKNPFFL